MKKTICWILAAICCIPSVKTRALTLTEDEPVVVYYMPKTQLLFTVEYDEIVTEVGPFYQYSARYLGTKDVLTKSERQFVLRDVTFIPLASADTTRCYVLNDKSGKLQLVSFSEFGTLAGYNVESKVDRRKTIVDSRKSKVESTDHLVGTETTRLMPLPEEQLMASSTAKMAEGAAKQIYRIREMRMNLLSGDMEKYPADGNALKLVIQEIDKRERELTALFIGSRTVTHRVHYVTYTPQSSGSTDSDILFRFSRHFGIVANDDLSGEPVNIQITRSAHSSVSPEKSAQKAPTLYYNLPGNGKMTVTYGEQELIKHPIEVAQWGVSIPVNNVLLNGSTRITFNPLTGALVSIEK